MEQESNLPTRAMRHIVRHFDDAEGCGTTGIADALDVSPSHLCHRFRSEFGRTPGQEIRGRRIELAKRLLRDTDMLVKEVAAEVGYLRSTYRAFLNAFRAETGMSPTEYRQRMQELATAGRSDRRHERRVG